MTVSEYAIDDSGFRRAGIDPASDLAAQIRLFTQPELRPGRSEADINEVKAAWTALEIARLNLESNKRELTDTIRIYYEADFSMVTNGYDVFALTHDNGGFLHPAIVRAIVRHVFTRKTPPRTVTVLTSIDTTTEPGKANAAMLDNAAMNLRAKGKPVSIQHTGDIRNRLMDGPREAAREA